MKGTPTHTAGPNISRKKASLMMVSKDDHHAFSDPAPTVALDRNDTTNDESSRPHQACYPPRRQLTAVGPRSSVYRGNTPPLHDHMDLASMVDSAYSQADWSMAPSSLATASFASASPSVPASGTRELDQEGSAALAAFDSLYTALSSIGFQPGATDNEPSPLRETLTYPQTSHDASRRGRPSPFSSVLSANGVPVARQGHSHACMSSTGLRDQPPTPFTTHDGAPTPTTTYGLASGPACPEASSQQQGMVAARSAVLEMQRQGLSVQNIQDLVQNMQSLLSTLQDTNPTAGDVMSQVPMDDSLRQSLLRMLLAQNTSHPSPFPMPAETPMMRSPSDQLRLSPPQTLTPHDLTPRQLQSPALASAHSGQLLVDDTQGQYGPYYMTPQRMVPIRHGHSLYATEGLHPYAPPPPSATMTPRKVNTPRGHPLSMSTPRGVVPGTLPPPLRGPQPVVEPQSQSERLPGAWTSRDKAFKLNSLPEDSEDRAASAPLPHGAGTGVFIPGVFRQHAAPPKRNTRTSVAARTQISAPLESQGSEAYDGLETQAFERMSLSSELPWTRQQTTVPHPRMTPRQAVRTPRPAPATPPPSRGNPFSPDAPTDNSDESCALSASSTGPFGLQTPQRGANGVSARLSPATPPAGSPRNQHSHRSANNSCAAYGTAVSAPIPESPVIRKAHDPDELSASISPASGGSISQGLPLAPALSACEETHLSLQLSGGLTVASSYGDPPLQSGRSRNKGRGPTAKTPPSSGTSASGSGRLEPTRGVPASSESLPLAVTSWQQDHASVTLFLALEKFNPASLMVQIQQHMVVVMALNTGGNGPSHVLRMRPEYAVRVQGSKSRPQPGVGVHLLLQKRSPGTTWTTYGQVQP